VFLLILIAGCKQSKLQSSMLEIELPTINTASATAPSPTATSTPTSLSSVSEAAYAEKGISVGELRTYTHYPTEHILYDEIFVDDRLDNVVYICQDKRYDISNSFRLQSASGETPALYTSWQINVRPFCYIAFTVENVSGDTIGIEFKSHCILCYDY
jgi:hypothetical protein